MGTRSYHAYYFRGRYYVLYLHWDGYPEGVGNEIVRSIPEDPVEYQKWLQAQRQRLAKWEYVLETQVLCISSSKLPSLLKSHAYDEPELLLRQLLDDRFDDEMPTPCYRVPDLNNNIEFTYTIDLDREVFTISNGAHFVLSKIPRNSWIEGFAYRRLYLSQVGVLIPQFVPEDSIADLTSFRSLPAMSKGTCTNMQQRHLTTVRPKGFLDFPIAIRHGPLLLAHLWNGVSAELASSMPFILRGLSPDEFAFREIAFSIISLCAGLTNGMKFENGERYKASWTRDWGALIPSEHPKGNPVIVPRVAMGYHVEGVEPGSAPQATTYWFCGVLVKLVADLTKSDHVQEAIAQAIEFVQSTGPIKQVLEILVLSIEHVILVHVVGEKAERTDTIALVNIPIHFTENPLHRDIQGMHDLGYIRWVDINKGNNEDEDKKATTDEEEEEGEKVEGEVEEEEEEVEKEEAEVTWPQEYKGFFAMMHLFEAVVQRTMAPARNKEGVFPTDIYEMILAYTDDSTYQACSTVSKKFHHYCLRNLRLLNGTVILGLTPPHPVSAVSPGKRTRDVLGSATSTSQPGQGTASNFEKYTDNAQNASAIEWEDARFILQEQANGSRGAYNIRLLWEHSDAPNNSTEWLAICGKSRRLSLVIKFAFLNYRASDPCESKIVQRHARGRTRHTPSPESYDNTRYWSCRWFPRKKREYVQEPSVRHLFELWKGILMAYRVEQVQTSHTDTFSMPAHTNESIFLAKDWSARPWKETWIGYIRYKRPDAIAGEPESWQLAYSEAEEKIREKAATQEYQPMFVITAVKLSARLHRWDAQSQQLVPVGENAGELSTCAEGDREKLEAFLLEMKGEIAVEKEKISERKRRAKAIVPLGED